jgi:hypothetical protein
VQIDNIKIINDSNFEKIEQLEVTANSLKKEKTSNIDFDVEIYKLNEAILKLS